MIIDTNNNSLRCPKVEITGTNISELDGERPVLTIPREQIRHIKLCYDTRAKNPFCQYFLGFTLLSMGLLGLMVTFYAGLSGNLVAQAEPGSFVIPIVPAALWLMTGVGFWLLRGIFKARYHLMIHSEEGISKIFFDKTADIGEIRLFIRKAQLKFGYRIDVSVLEEGHQSS